MIIKFIIILVLIVLIAIIINVIEDYNKNKIKMSFRESMDLIELPVVTFYNKDIKLNFLLDTGANLCVINSRIIDSLNYKKIDEKGSIYGMEGNTIDIEYIYMDFTYNNRYYNSTFQVVDMQEAFNKIKQESGVTIHGILGSKFFEKYKYVLDFKELKVYTK